MSSAISLYTSTMEDGRNGSIFFDNSRSCCDTLLVWYAEMWWGLWGDAFLNRI